MSRPAAGVRWIFAFAVALSSARSGLAQASVEPRGFGSISFGFQHINHTGHIHTDGTTDNIGLSANRDFNAEGDYGVTDHLTVSAGLPFVFSKFTDPGTLPPFLPFFPVDQCRCWNSGFQDFRFAAHYNVFGHPHSALLVTPSVSVIVPSHAYEYRGEAVLGRYLRELQLGMDIRQRIDAISQHLYIEANYSYSFVQVVLDIPNNRSNGKIEGAFLLTEKLSLNGRLNWQYTHGGLRFGSPPPASLEFPGEFTLVTLGQHDRLQRDNYWRAGFGAVHSMQRMDVFADFSTVIAGTDTHLLRAVTFGVSFPFQLGRHLQ